MLVLYLSIFILWPLSALADFGQFCYVWQLKEYRFDRLGDYFSTLSGKKFFHSWRILKRPFIYLILFLILPINLKSLSYAVIAILFIDLIYNFWAITKHNLLRPKLTAKSTILIILALLTEGILFFVFLNSHIIFIILALRWFTFSALAALAKLPTGLAKIIYLKIAKNKLAKFNKLTVIGVTGSYGKTTVKNFLEQMLSAKFKIIKTPKNINTEIGIAKFILNTDFSQTDIFIVEMAAYKIGEIKIICEMVKPRLGILTAINEQHLPLFGSIKNTQTAKYELLRSLPSDGLAIVNSDNKYCREFIPELKCQVKTFGQLAEFKPDCLVSDISSGADKLKFKATPDYEIETNIIGGHNAINIAPVILAADHLDFTKNEIEQGAGRFNLPEATMQIANYGSSVIIDDSYNANPASFAAALKFLADNKTSGKKIVITRGMIELGKASPEAHKKIGRLIAETAGELIIISPDSIKELESGIGDKNITVKTIFKHTELLDYIKNNKNQNNIILLEGRMPELIIKEIKS
ncbi:MAG: UDP-N-acetylmuramoyl-tripeptide--D-alanyl-D-alanine ligase [Patescibacteria group bacterium]|nr:UDP-N-acetylmuramoyl-tripeptide--D-alanyl-D-alanine ligase [Patescibacteria group bacterium]